MKPPIEVTWVGDSWACARERKFLLGLNVTPAERLKWLESMIVLAWQTGALPKQGRAFQTPDAAVVNIDLP